MRYLLLILVAYYVVKSVGKLLANLKVVDQDSEEIKGQSEDGQNRLRVDESEIEDADFKEVE